MLILEASRRRQPVPPLARWCLGAGIVATIDANLAHGIGDGLIGALVSAWPALALADSFELLMTLWRMAWNVRSRAVRPGYCRHLACFCSAGVAALEEPQDASALIGKGVSEDLRNLI